MRQVSIALLTIILVVSLVAAAFTINQVGNEEKRLKFDLERRSNLLAESLKESIEPNFVNKSNAYLQQVVEKFADEERFAGLAVYDSKENVNAISSVLSKDVFKKPEVIVHAMDQDSATGDFMNIEGRKLYLFASPLHDNSAVTGALLIVQNANYIDARLFEIWKNNLLRLFVQIALLTIAAILTARWIIYQPIHNLVESIKLARASNTDEDLSRISKFSLLGPLVKEIVKIKKSLIEARLTASEEARLGLEKIDSPWTAQRLKEFVKDVVKNKAIFIVSNREPYIHTKENGKTHYYQPASGLVTALEPLAQAAGGKWIAFGSGNADRFVVDANDSVRVPPEEPSYTLRRVWLSEDEEQRYYYGFANEGLWPLCHIAHTRPIFREEDWQQYKLVNSKFAKVVLEEIRHIDRPIILIQDFHLALLPRLIKEKRPDSNIELFWHIPWPNPESFSICPWKKEILNGMLGADLIGFHTQLHCNNFIETVGKELESLIDIEQLIITRDNHTTYVRPFPASVTLSNGESKKAESITINRKQLEKNLNLKTKFIGLGIDRLDYTKGILERLKAIEIFFIKYPQYQHNFTFIQIAAPTREKVPRYQEFAREVETEINRVNKQFKTREWQPIIYLKKHYNRLEINRFYQSTDVCLVTSLHDGMNLVAKEFVSSRFDNKGVLILSQFTGASRELKDAVLINPYDAQETAGAIKKALEMSPLDQNKRMKRMRTTIKNYNIYRWSAELLKAVVNLSKPL